MIARWLGVTREVAETANAKHTFGMVFHYTMDESKQVDLPALGNLLQAIVGPRTQETIPTMGDKLRAEGGRRLFLRMLQRRFGDIPSEVVERLENTSIDEIEVWAVKLLDAATLDAIFED